MMKKILVTPRSFAKYSKKPIEKLRNAGFEIIGNDSGEIFTEERMEKAIADADAVIVGVDPLPASILAKAPRLKVVSKYGVGLDNVDLDYCKEHGIEVAITRGANSNAVADFAFALLLAVARRMGEIDRACRAGDWKKRVALDIWGKKIGILGLGAIGKGVALRAKGFNMEIYGYDVYKDEAFIKENDIRFTSVEEIFDECDFVSVHLPLVEGTRHLIDREMLKRAKNTLVIVNTARGGIIDEDALYEALRDGAIYGAGLDVFEREPASESPLIGLDNVIVGSHCSASSVGATDMMSMMAVDNVLRVFEGNGE